MQDLKCLRPLFIHLARTIITRMSTFHICTRYISKRIQVSRSIWLSKNPPEYWGGKISLNNIVFAHLGPAHSISITLNHSTCPIFYGPRFRHFSTTDSNESRSMCTSMCLKTRLLYSITTRSWTHFAVWLLHFSPCSLCSFFLFVSLPHRSLSLFPNNME